MPKCANNINNPIGAGKSCVAQASSAPEALRMAFEQRPDVCLVAVGLPGNGIEAARMIDRMFELGDAEGRQVWQRIKAAIEELQAVPTAVHLHWGAGGVLNSQHFRPAGCGMDRYSTRIWALAREGETVSPGL